MSNKTREERAELWKDEAVKNTDQLADLKASLYVRVLHLIGASESKESDLKYLDTLEEDITKLRRAYGERKDKQTTICIGCGNLSIRPIPATALACCPENNYKPLTLELFNEWYERK